MARRPDDISFTPPLEARILLLSDVLDPTLYFTEDAIRKRLDQLSNGRPYIFLTGLLEETRASKKTGKIDGFFERLGTHDRYPRPFASAQ